MKIYSKKVRVLLTTFCLLAGGCKHDDGWKPGGPISAGLLGIWKLEKVITPTRTLMAEQIGYTEVLKIQNKDGFEIDEIYKDDSLTVTRYWRKNPGPIAKAKDMTVLVTYRYDLKRFYKMHETVSQPTVLEASAYMPELGGAADTVKFFYKQVW